MTDDHLFSMSLHDAPEPHLIPDLSKSIQQAVRDLPDGKKGALVVLATPSEINAAIVSKLDHGWSIQAWLKYNGTVETGATVMKSW